MVPLAGVWILHCSGDLLGDCLLNSLGGISHGGGELIWMLMGGDLLTRLLIWSLAGASHCGGELILGLNMSGELNCKKVGDLCWMLAGGELSWVWMPEGGELFCIYEGGVCNTAPCWLRIEAKVAFVDVVELAPVEAVLVEFVELVELIELVELDRILRVCSFCWETLSNSASSCDLNWGSLVLTLMGVCSRYSYSSRHCHTLTSILKISEANSSLILLFFDLLFNNLLFFDLFFNLFFDLVFFNLVFNRGYLPLRNITRYARGLTLNSSKSDFNLVLILVVILDLDTNLAFSMACNNARRWL